VKRRNALKHIGAGLSAGFILPWLTSCKDEEIGPEIRYDGVIGVIGAGAAGLFAADYLLNKGIKVEIFEASARIGGRVRVLRSYDTIGDGLWFNPNSNLSSDFPVELGADRILGQNSIWSKFINQQKYSTFPLSANTNDLFWVNNALLDYPTASAIPGFQGAESFVAGIPSQAGSALTVQQSAEGAGIAPAFHNIVNGWVGNQSGTTNDRLAMHGIAEAAGLRERDAFNSILSHNPMADVLIGSYIKAADKVQLNSVVRQIDYSGEKIVVTGEKTTGGSTQPFTATFDKLILTVPVTVLQSGDITFNPPLPASKTTALAKMGMDSAIRVLLDFRKNFWGETNFRNIYGGQKGTEYFNPGASGRSTVARTLSVTLSGKTAEELSPLGVDIIPQLLAELDEMFDGQASPNVRRDTTADANFIAVVQDWGKEPFIRGSMSYLKPGGTNQDREALSTPIGDTLFFAGEATDILGEAGTISGALQSAERAAKEILSSITGV
jgi:monoamine oxidase